MIQLLQFKDLLLSYLILEELRYRTARIYKPTRTAMQSGEHNTKHWRIDFDILEGGGRWENPLIGWASR
jgi:NADH dehydrogenase (ubiquinone) Fe-S protein 4